MKLITKIFAGLAGGVLAVGGLSACSDADVSSRNVSKDADNFKVPRQIVVYNSITDKYILEVDGFCSLGNDDSAGQVSYICKVGPDEYVKDIIMKSDNTFVYAHQLKGVKVSANYYKVILKPSVVLPDPELR